MRRIVWYLFIVLIIGMAWVAYNRPDWVVAGFPKHASALTPTPQVVKPLAPPAVAKEPIADIPDNTSVAPAPAAPAAPAPKPQTHTIPASVGQGGTPLPAVEAVDGTDYQRSDGYQNMCMQLADGSWTTVIYQGSAGPGMFPYKGDIDVATGAPATATGSEQWCAEHASV